MSKSGYSDFMAFQAGLLLNGKFDVPSRMSCVVTRRTTGFSRYVIKLQIWQEEFRYCDWGNAKTSLPNLLNSLGLADNSPRQRFS